MYTLYVHYKRPEIKLGWGVLYLSRVSTTKPLLFRLRLFLEAALARGVRENIKQPVALFPADAGVGDAHAVREILARQQVLPAWRRPKIHHLVVEI